MKYFLMLISTMTAALIGQEKYQPKISAYMFGDYFYNVMRDTSIGSLGNAAAAGAKDLNGVQFRRIYVTFDGDISPSVTSRFRVEGTTGAPFIKDAYLKWKDIYAGADLIFGMQPTPAFEHSEAFWGYRSLEKTILDLRSIVSSRDLAVSLRGTFGEGIPVGYWVMIGNNSGTGPETDKYKRIYAHIDVQPTEKFNISVYGDYKMKSNINDPASTAIPSATIGNNTITGALFIGYTEKNLFSAGIEGFYQSMSNGTITASPTIFVNDKSAAGISFFGSYALSSMMTLVGRYDHFDPNIDKTGDSRQFILAGIDCKVDKKFSVIPNIQLETYESIPTASVRRSVEASLTARVTFYYTFL